MDTHQNVRRRGIAHRWLNIELGAVATLVTIAWMNEPGSLERFGLMCACWAPFAYGAALRIFGREDRTGPGAMSR